EKLGVPFTVSVNDADQTLQNIRAQLKGPGQFAWQALDQGAQFCLTRKINLDEALRWADASIQNEERFENLSTKADILKALNRPDEAKTAWNHALEIAKAPQLYTYGRQLQNQKRGAEAMEIFKEVAKRFPQGVYGTLAQARIKSAAGDFAGAANDAKQAQAAAPTDAQKQSIQALITRLEAKQDINKKRGLSRTGTIASMGRSPQSALLHMTHHSITHCWAAAVVVAILAVAGTANSADAPPLLPPEQMNASEIQLALQKLNVLGRVLYIAAHPDDENTNLMALWANGSLYDGAYLSITRADGGQDLIGPELRQRLGVIRTEELLAARRVDHAKQFFSRAIDFGFSKTPEGTMRIWDHDRILSDVVWVVRKFRPDVMVTRFSPEDRLTHGHHTASAILALETFSAAGDPNRFPEQLAFVKPWS